MVQSYVSADSSLGSRQRLAGSVAARSRRRASAGSCEATRLGMSSRATNALLPLQQREPARRGGHGRPPLCPSDRRCRAESGRAEATERKPTGTTFPTITLGILSFHNTEAGRPRRASVKTAPTHARPAPRAQTIVGSALRTRRAPRTRHGEPELRGSRDRQRSDAGREAVNGG
jgi:hypothetical protein